MYAEERRRQIASLTAVEGRVNVTELAQRFEVTAETIRRDLSALHDEGAVQRVHGGAVASQSYRSTEILWIPASAPRSRPRPRLRKPRCSSYRIRKTARSFWTRAQLSAAWASDLQRLAGIGSTRW